MVIGIVVVNESLELRLFLRRPHGIGQNILVPVKTKVPMVRRSFPRLLQCRCGDSGDGCGSFSLGSETSSFAAFAQQQVF